MSAAAKLFITSAIAIASASSACAAPGMAVESTTYGAPAWSPYLVGAGIGVLAWITFALANKTVGASSFYATIAGMLGKLLAPTHTGRLKYFKENPPSIDWRFVFMLATITGGFLAAWTGGELRNELLPQMWIDRFGDSVGFRAAVAFLGGAMMAFGARLAGGCTSGHGISGTLQLSLASWLTVDFMFAGGIATAFLLYTIF
jgi:hypothetical protein